MTVDEVVAMARAYYRKPGNSAGGNLHVVLDDGNLQNKFVAHCLLRAHDAGDDDGRALALALLDLSMTQRNVVCGRLWHPKVVHGG